jgi:hypothetical protein
LGNPVAIQLQRVAGLDDKLAGRVLFQRRRMARRMLPHLAGIWKSASDEVVMNTKVNFIQLITSVVGLSIGVGIGTATVLLGVAALLQ